MLGLPYLWVSSIPQFVCQIFQSQKCFIYLINTKTNFRRILCN